MTRLRDVTTLTVTVREFYDMQISMDPTVENDVKTSAPGRVVRFIVNVTNAGNVPDVPTLDNHTSDRSGTDITVQEFPGMGTLDGWDVSWKIIRQVGLDLESEEDCVATTSAAASYPGQLRLPRRHRLLAPPRNGSVRNLHDGRYRSHRPRCTTHDPKSRLKVVSMMGNAEQGGDHDDSSSWVGDLLDSNEKIVTINLRTRPCCAISLCRFHIGRCWRIHPNSY